MTDKFNALKERAKIMKWVLAEINRRRSDEDKVKAWDRKNWLPIYRSNPLMTKWRKVSRYFMEQWTTNREKVYDDYCNMLRDTFRKKYWIGCNIYKKYFGSKIFRKNKIKDSLTNDVEKHILAYWDIPKAKYLFEHFWYDTLKESYTQKE